MGNIMSKTKEILAGKNEPMTCEEAKMLTYTGNLCTMEQRVAAFIKDTNQRVIDNAKFGRFQCLVTIPEELISQIGTIQKEYKDRGFTIHTLEPKLDNTFVINWK